jgi:hypothetical protein
MSSLLRDAISKGAPVVIENPLGIETHDAVISHIALPHSGHTPGRRADKWYNNAGNRNTFEYQRRENCVGCMTTQMINLPTRKDPDQPRLKIPRKSCAFCGKDKATSLCLLCHGYFHSDHRHLPVSQKKLIAIDFGNRYSNGQPEYTYVENFCFHLAHEKGRQTAWGGAHREVLLQTSLVHYNNLNSTTANEDTDAETNNSTQADVGGTTSEDRTSEEDLNTGNESNTMEEDE